MPQLAVQPAHSFKRAMQEDRLGIAGAPQFRDQPLRLAQGICADQHAAIGMGGARR